MTDIDLLIIEEPSKSGRWLVQSRDRTVTHSVCSTEREAIRAARAVVPVDARGRVRIVASRGGSADRIVSLRQAAAPAVAGLPFSVGDSGEKEMTIPDAVSAFGAAGARLQGQAYDPDADGQADGEEALDSILAGGADTASKKVFNTARVWWDILIMLGSLVGALIGVPLVAPWIGGGIIGVALSTLALSGGMFLATVIFMSKKINAGTREGLLLASLVVAGSFLVSTLIAGTLGQPAPELENPAFTDAIQRAFTLGGPPDLRFVYAAIAIVGYILFGAAQIYGWLGASLSIAAGLVIAWRAVDLWKGYRGLDA